MKLPTQILIIGLFSGTLQFSNAGQPFFLSTDASGSITSGSSWSSTGVAGTIQNNVDASPATPENSVLFVNGFSGTGTLSDLQFYANENRYSTNPSANISITLGGGGTGDLFTRDATTGGAISAGPSGSAMENYFDSFDIANLSGVNSVTFEAIFSEPIANTAFGGNPDGQLTFVPWLGTINAANLGAGLTDSSFNLTTSLIDVVTSTDGGSTWLPNTAGMDSLLSTSYNSAAAGSTTFTADAMPDSHRFLIKGLNVDGDFDPDGVTPNFQQTDLQNAYAAGIRWTVALDDGSNFPADTILRYTFDGQQYNNSVAAAGAAIDSIPEPSSSLLSAFAGLLVLVHRRR